MAVSLRDARTDAADRRWFADAYAQWVGEMAREAAAAAAVASGSTAEASARAEAARRLVASGSDVLLVLRDGAAAGFAVVERSAALHRLAEFWIHRDLRRLGVGGAAVPLVFDRYEGEWETAALATDAAAVRFWRDAVRRYTGGRHTERLQDGEIRQRFFARASSRASNGAR